MKYFHAFKIKGLPRRPNGSHGHWARINAERKKWHALVGHAISYKPKEPIKQCRVTCIRSTADLVDYDNLVMSFKPVIDGLVIHGIIQDDSMRVIVDRRYCFEKTTRKDAHITVCVEEL